MVCTELVKNSTGEGSTKLFLVFLIACVSVHHTFLYKNSKSTTTTHIHWNFSQNLESTKDVTRIICICDVTSDQKLGLQLELTAKGMILNLNHYVVIGLFFFFFTPFV